MKTLLIILLASLGLLFATTASTFAIEGGAVGQVRVNSDVIDVNYMTLTPTQDMNMPQVYNNFTGEVSSEDTTLVANGLNGQDATFSVTGTQSGTYNISFNHKGELYDNKNHKLIITYSIGTGGSTANGNVKSLDTNGNDTLAIKGTILFDGRQPIGSYNNYANPLVVTVTIDEL